MSRLDDPAINSGMELYRRIPPWGDRVVWEESGRPRPSSQNFKDKDHELSVYIAAETTPEISLKGHDGFGLMVVTAGEIRQVLGPLAILCRDDIDPSNGHVLVCFKTTNGQAKQLSIKARWVDGRWPRRAPDVAP